MTPTVRHEHVGPRGAPHRLRIAHLSDLHLWHGDRKLRRIEQRLAPWKPDVLALTGDYADTPIGRRKAIDWIRAQARAQPVCWIAGNHDRWGGGGFLRELETVRHAHAIDHRDARISAAGGRRYRFTSLDREHNPAPADAGPTIVLVHDPARIEPEKLRPPGSGLLLAGHLHGGQITLWRDRHGRPQPATWCYRWLVDRADIDGVPLIVSRGLGDTLPLRFRTPHEIVMIDFWAA